MGSVMDYIDILWIYFLGCLSGAGLYCYWLERQKPAPTLQPSINEDEATRQVELVMAARAAMGRNLIPDTVN